jgi:Putative Actinobacterial Holin-X, holin superfamily III
MDTGADSMHAASPQQTPTADLVRQLTEQVSALVRDELKLAQLEMTRKGKQAGFGAGWFGGAAMVALYGLACLIACGVVAISGVVAAWLAALIVGVALFAAAGAAAMFGKSRMQKATPPIPEEAIDSVKRDADVIKEGARR